jgi:plastocyanin
MSQASILGEMPSGVNLVSLRPLSAGSARAERAAAQLCVQPSEGRQLVKRHIAGASVAASTAALALLLAGPGAAAPSASTVTGTVGPGFTIGVKLGGKKVTTLKAGVSYRFVIVDRSSIHNFRLSGPGLNRVLTGIGFTGTKTFTFKLKKGTWRFVCDPHASSMRGSFRAV